MIIQNWVGLWTLVRRDVGRIFRVAIQTLVTPWISALLYIFIFGRVVGQRISLIAGVPYITFVLPGILMMNVLSSAFAHSSSSVYMHRFTKSIEELLVAPFSYLEMIIGYVTGGVVRGGLVGIGVYVIAIFFGGARIGHPFLFLVYMIAVAIIFGLLGMLVGLWAKNFEQLNILNVFIIMPLSFLGGVFNSITMLPPAMQAFTRANPFFYFVDGLRYSMIGVHESNSLVGGVIIVGLILLFGGLVWYLFKTGYRMRE